MQKVLIKNIKELFQTYAEGESPSLVRGKQMDRVPTIKNAWLAIENGIIVDYGKMEDWPGITDWRGLEVMDADGKMVLPAFVDSHTHIVFAKTREEEFVDRIKGLSYQEIAAKGGGILNSAKTLRQMSEEELYEQALKRANKVIRMGTGALEIKSGYGLTVESEMKMLRVIKRLKETLPIPVKATFLGAHAYPQEFKDNKQGYVDLIVKEMIPTVAKESLAEYIDAFLETNYFDAQTVATLLEAGAAHGLVPKVHVNQFTSIGGIETCLTYNARSVDHLEEMTEGDFKALSGGSTMATILPTCSYFLSIPYAPARKMMEANIPVAIASDYNPGSTPTGNMEFVLSTACIKNRMTPNEALTAATINGAYALNLENELGTITPGKRANLLITKPIDNLALIPYSFGEQLIEEVMINGEIMEK